MLFHTVEFAVFFAAVLLALRWYRGATRDVLLLAASYYFYMAWDWRFGGLILASTLIDYGCGIAIEEATEPRRRRLFLVLSLTANLALLGFFKYLGLFTTLVQDVLGVLGIERDLQAWEVILPVGISFFTFQSMSHSVDVYRRQIPAERNLVRFALYVAFFPQLVAGPIVRARDFLPQLDLRRRLTAPRLYWGLERFLVGLFKKTVIADNLSTLVDVVYAEPDTFDSGLIWLATLGYAVQIYADFSGYSDMAIGLARILGFRFQENFDFPYRARSPQEFWRRWHISLSSWLRDYLYISLGGNRGGAARTMRNLMLTMLLGGLWHGASYTFVLWGLIHGLLLAAQRAAGEAGERFLRWARGVPAMALTFLAVLLAWVPFRATSIGDAATVYARLFRWQTGSDTAVLVGVDLPFLVLLMGAVALAHLISVADLPLHRRVRESTWGRAALLGLTAYLVHQYRYDGAAPFVYFQF